MNRLEEIKERLHQLLPTTKYKITDYQEESFKWASAYQSDIQYLLQRLEIADDALKFYAELNNYKLPNGHYVETTTVVTSDSGNRARKTLEQIRK